MLKIPYQEESLLKSYLSRLVITLEAHAISLDPPAPPPPVKDGQPGQGPGPKQIRELLFAGTVDEREEPVVAFHGAGSEEDDEPGHVLAVWKLDVFLSEP